MLLTSESSRCLCLKTRTVAVILTAISFIGEVVIIILVGRIVGDFGPILVIIGSFVSICVAILSGAALFRNGRQLYIASAAFTGIIICIMAVLTAVDVFAITDKQIVYSDSDDLDDLSIFPFISAFLLIEHIMALVAFIRLARSLKITRLQPPPSFTPPLPQIDGMIRGDYHSDYREFEQPLGGVKNAYLVPDGKQREDTIYEYISEHYARPSEVQEKF